MKDFNIFGVHWKIQFLEVGHEKPIYRRDCLKKGGGAWQERVGGGCFWGGSDTPMHTKSCSIEMHHVKELP